MRRLGILAAACAAVLLLSVQAALADPVITTDKRSGPPATRSPALRACGSGVSARSFLRPRFVPAPEALATAAAVNGTIMDMSGYGLGNATVSCYVGEGAPATTTTTGYGQYSFPSVPVAAGNGEITMLTSDEYTWYDRWNLTWGAPGPTTFDMQPGGMYIDGTTGGPWAEWADTLETDAYTTNGSQAAEVDREDPGSLWVTAPALPGIIAGIGAYFYSDEGVEINDLNGVSIASGDVIGPDISVYEANAQRAWTGGSAWNKPRGSGKPGSTLRVWLENYPAGWVNEISGVSADPHDSAPRSFGTTSSPGPTRYSRALKVPRTAVPGYAYVLGITHTTGVLDLTTWFQICTFKPSRTRVPRNARFRISGVVPVQGHDGTTPGKRTTVHVYAHLGKAPQPTTFKLWKQGWVYITSVKTDRFGRFRTPLYQAKRTVTLVGLYPGDDWYYAAFTSPATVGPR